MLRIKRIRFGNEITSIIYEVENENEVMENITLVVPEMPLPEFRDAMQDLRDSVCIINEMNGNIADELMVTGVTFTHKDNVTFKATISAKRNVELSNSPFNMNTPVVLLGELKEENDNYDFQFNLKTKLITLMEKAEAFINGERELKAQQEIDFTE